MAKKKLWEQKAVPKSHKGKFGEKAAKAGMSTHAYAEKEKHAGGTLGREANLALTFEGQAHKKRHERNFRRLGHK